MQGMAGNIIHAIATTNATIAGMIVVEAIKILNGFSKSCKVVVSAPQTALIKSKPLYQDWFLISKDHCSLGFLTVGYQLQQLSDWSDE